MSIAFKTISLIALVAATSATDADLKVEVYDGPIECDDAQIVKKGDSISMHYTGTIDQSSATGEKGKQFRSSRDGRGGAFDVVIGIGQVMKAWDDGIVGLCVGAKASIIVPPEMGYGPGGAGGLVPAGATLNFAVEVLAINDPDAEESVGEDGLPLEPNIFKEVDTNSDGLITESEVAAHFKSQHDENWQESIDMIYEGEDVNNDGVISWDEFTGSKGENPMGDEF